MHQKTLYEQSQDLLSRKYSSVELTQAYLDRIDRFDSAINSFITVSPEASLLQAEKADKMIAQGQSEPLTGIPIAVKDIFCEQDTRTTCASRMLENFISPYDATVVARLRETGAVLIGKTNMDEFAMGSSTENSYFGATRNPWDPDRVPGGSSGGSAGALAARLCAGAIGTDTGGSIRQPAAYCGLTGLKPTYGRISRWGMIAFASSLDQAGPMTHTAQDSALILSTLAGHDRRDSTSIDQAVPDYTENLDEPVNGIRIGLCKEYFDDNLDDAIKQSIMTAVQELEKLGAQISEISLPHTPLSIPAYYVIAPAECSANLARYDGVRFGHRCADPIDLDDLYRRSRTEGFGREVRSRIMVGTFALSAGYYDAYYRQAQRVRRLISNDFEAAFNKVDLVIGPTTPTTAFRIGEKVEDQISMYQQDIFTIASNLAGLPAASIPVGFLNNLPIGMQIIGKHLDEARILQVCHRFQMQTNWHNQIPAAFND